MDILIKNIGGLPEDGDLTLTITPKGQVILGGCIYTHNFGKEVKAIALPPHGELISRGGALFQLQAEALGISPNDKDFEGIKKGLLIARKIIIEAPVIVEATK